MLIFGRKKSKSLNKPKQIELSKNNHFKYGYGSSFQPHPEKKTHWNVSYGTCKESGTFGDECISTARQIGNKTRGPIWVLFSGGIDSEVVIRAFLKSGVDFKAAILQFKDNLNLHDISHAIVACQELGVEHKILELDLLRFWGSNHFWELARLTSSVSPQFVSTMWLVEELKGDYCVIGSGDSFLVRSGSDSKSWTQRSFSNFYRHDRGKSWDFWEEESVTALYRFFQFRGIAGCPGFFQYTPEIMRAFLADSLTHLFLEKNLNEVTTKALKQPLYHKYFSVRPREKFNGFEKVMEHDHKYRSLLLEEFPDRNSVFLTSLEKQKERLNVKNKPSTSECN